MSESNFVAAPPNLWATIVCTEKPAGDDPELSVVTKPALILGWSVSQVGRRPVFADGGNSIYGDSVERRYRYQPLALLPAPDGGWVDVLGHAGLPIVGLSLDEIVALYKRLVKDREAEREVEGERAENRRATMRARRREEQLDPDDADTDDVDQDDTDDADQDDTDDGPKMTAWPSSDDAGLGLGKSTHGALAKVIAALDPAAPDYVPRLVRLFADLEKGHRRASELGNTEPPAGTYLFGPGCVVVAAREIGQPPAVLYNYRDLLWTTDVVADLNHETAEEQP
jgi:hypothetical protein